MIVELNRLTQGTGGEGIYAFPALPSGVYTVAAAKEGYVGQSTTANIDSGEIDIIDFVPAETPASDVNGDGELDAVDVQLVINAVLGVG